MNGKKLANCLFSGAGLRFLALLVLALGTSVATFSQQITGTIVGTVTDSTGAVVNTATVKATEHQYRFCALGRPPTAMASSVSTISRVGNYTVECHRAELQKIRAEESATHGRPDLDPWRLPGSRHRIADRHGHRGSAAREHKRCRAGQNHPVR